MLSQSPDLHEKAWGLLKVTQLMKLQTKYQSQSTVRSDFRVTMCKAHQFSQGADGVLVPGGFGHVEGKILAAKYARENNVPYLGICLGMQVAVIEFARSNLGLKDANSGELDAGTRHPCLILIPEVTVVAEFLWACIFFLHPFRDVTA